VKKPARRERATASGARHIPAKVKRAVWRRDQGRCAFVAESGRRCAERGRLEFHHAHPHGAGGQATVANIELRCRSHNAYEAELYYGGLSPRGSTVPGDSACRVT
jgi:5-methylcytosine-specific restriction endonuclease McrA